MSYIFIEKGEVEGSLIFGYNFRVEDGVFILIGGEESRKHGEVLPLHKNI